ncbi:hypothetical protein HYH03_000724 [Edaphochlamys debaryana]|uniref:Aurora kinase n=1 Tax=Edaphochlamys debaryana TaxID=47281 RepID=A0A835YJ95_9CHLO|nr:hypothetical protein HYH03_000724 [Edaphochlamys debaryana]|eukprot:KAG2502238.1 hypothetical protein HYH03_000724 [Edaphochlamys debaryana]
MFKADARSATNGGQSAGPGPPDSPAGAALSPLPPSTGKVDAAKGHLKIHVKQSTSSRDLSLAALITSPVRGPNAGPNGGPYANSPMPSLRDASSPNLFLSSNDDGSLHVGTNHLFGTSHGGPAHAASAFSTTAANAYSPGNASRFGSSLPSHSPVHHGSLSTHLSKLSSNLAATGPGGAVHKSHSTALAHSASLSRDNPEESRDAGSGHLGRLALPHLNANSPRGVSADSQVLFSNRPANGAVRGSAASTPPAEPAEAADEGEEEDDVPGTLLLGLNPAVPAPMRRRTWTLDDYQVVKRMYKGSTSAVYRATCLRSGMTVALKAGRGRGGVYFLSRVPVNVVHMIRREIELHLPLVHRNIIMLYAAFQDEKHIVLVQEYASRGDLFGIHRSMNCRLTETQASELVLAPFLEALAYLHARGIMHRDIKPENILFTQDWALKIADFGVSINVQVERAVTRTGTADYMAPEVERCPLKHAPEDNKDNPSLAYTTAIDIWSVGVLAYELLVGFPPFVSDNNAAPEEHHALPNASVAAFMAEQATRRTLRFPASTSAAAKDFIMATLAEASGDRPTAQQLLKHPWLFKVARASGQLERPEGLGYPVFPTDFLDVSRPHPFTLLGKDLVLWRDGSGTWRAFEDACPHRLAPLSEGRIEKDGTLLCAYHAWRFDGCGKVQDIPQVESREAVAKASASPRSCARAHPTREAQGLLWVWGESGSAAEAESGAKPLPLIPELDDLPASRLNPLPWFFRDLPYSHDYFVENITDPAHVIVSHHNVAGSRYTPDQFVSVDPVRPVSAQEGFLYSTKYRTPISAGSKVVSSTTEFTPPSRVKITANFEDGAALILALYSSPTIPGHTRHIGRQILIKDKNGKPPKGLAFFGAPMPVWLSHTLASVFLHQDQVFLHQQERIVAGRDEAYHTAKYFMPAPADNMTVAFRTWLGTHAGGRIPYAGNRALAPIDRTKVSLFDTYTTHTQQCSVCSKALANLQKARAIVVAAAAASVLAAVALTAVTAAAKASAAAAAGAAAAEAAVSALLSLPPTGALVAAALAAALWGASRVMDALIGMMHEYKFSHADNH